MDVSKKIISGKRKTAVAKLKLRSGKGNIIFNRMPFTELGLFHRLALIEPIKIYEREFGEGELNYDIHLNVHGGGKESQIQAARLAIAKALLEISGSETLKKAFVEYDRNIIVPDSRRKEACKPGDSKARAKRQTSYR